MGRAQARGIKMLKCGFPLGLAPDRLPRFRAGSSRTQLKEKMG